MSSQKKIAIIGGGPSALMLAAALNSAKFSIALYERNAALGRKFLVAGKGGFNLTHAEPVAHMLQRYSPPGFLQKALKHFDNKSLRDWLRQRGIDTYTGTSNRVFPVKGIKPISVLNAFEKELELNKVQVFFQHVWKGWNENGQLLFENNNGIIAVNADIVVFALGGGSWKVTGSHGEWLPLFEEKGISTKAFEASNCAFRIRWKPELLKRSEGEALKNCVFSCGGRHKKGEAVLTAFGIEGSGVYALGPEVRRELSAKGKALLHIDLKPDLDENTIYEALNTRSNKSVKERLEKKLRLSKVQIELLKQYSDKEEYQDPAKLTSLIKRFPLEIDGLAPLDEAISSAGGICLTELTEKFELKKLPHHYCIGEMTDWDAPTGGYLLQGCFSMGKYLADRLNEVI